MPKNTKGEEITQEQFDALSPEDKAAATKVPGPAPVIEASQIKGMKELMTEAISEYATTVANEPEPGPTETVPVQPTEVDPLQSAITQHTDPRFAQQDIEIAAAADAGLFYAAHPEALKHKDEIEAGFNNLKSQGKAFTREAVYEWWRGSAKNFDRLVAEGVEADKQKVKDAENAETVDASGRPVVQSTIKVDHTTPEEEVAKSLENVEF